MVMVTVSPHDAIASEPTALDLSVSSLPASFELNLHAPSLGNSVEVMGNTDHATAPKLRADKTKIRNSIVTSFRGFTAFAVIVSAHTNAVNSPQGSEPVVTMQVRTEPAPPRP